MTSAPRLRVAADVFERQAIIAAEHGNPALAANLRRAAELARLPEDEAARVAGALRSDGSSPGDAAGLADWLDAHGCPLNAAFVSSGESQ